MKAFKTMSRMGLLAALLAAGLAVLNSGCMTASQARAPEAALSEQEVSMIEAEGEGSRRDTRVNPLSAPPPQTGRRPQLRCRA